MARETDRQDLTAADMVELLHAAAEDERDGRLIRCSTEREIRDLIAGVQQQPM